jgi:hypothetical protein
MASFAMPQGVTVEQMLVAMSQQDIEPEPQPEAVKPARKRARDAAGRLQADDPATPVDEAWEPAES